MSRAYPPGDLPGWTTAQQFQDLMADVAKIVARLENIDKNILSIAESLADIAHRYEQETKRS